MLSDSKLLLTKNNFKKRGTSPFKINLIISSLKVKKNNPKLPMNWPKSEMIKLFKNKWKNKKPKPFNKSKTKSYFLSHYLEHSQRKIPYK